MTTRCETASSEMAAQAPEARWQAWLHPTADEPRPLVLLALGASTLAAVAVWAAELLALTAKASPSCLRYRHGVANPMCQVHLQHHPAAWQQSQQPPWHLTMALSTAAPFDAAAAAWNPPGPPLDAGDSCHESSASAELALEASHNALRRPVAVGAVAGAVAVSSGMVAVV